MSGKTSLEEVRSAITKQSELHFNFKPYPAGGIPEKDIPPMLFCDGARGVVCGIGKSTCFPVSMLRGATFDIELEQKIGQAIAEEVLAYGGNLFAGVCINLLYNPGWGRGQETYGEDPFHLGEMGSAMVRGVQSKGVIACVKHFAFNQMENSRFKVSIECDIRTEREVFLPHFKKCVDNGAGAIMTAYNKYKGVHCGHHDYLINKVLKGEWGFPGFVMSDFIWGIRDTVEAANGGQDMEMCNTRFFGKALEDAVKEGRVPERVVEEAAERIIRTLLSFQSIKSQIDKDIVGSHEHVELALQSAREGITLLKNEGQVLPLNYKKMKKITVIGHLAEEMPTGDKGSSEVYPAYVTSPLQGIVSLADSCDVTYYDGLDLNHCRRLAQCSDAVVFVLGYDYRDEGEYVAEDKKNAFTGAVGGDRVSGLGLHPGDVTLIQEVAPLNPNSVVVLIGGSMIMVEEWQESVKAILMAFYPGMEGGTAVAEILFGKTNPSGKLPFVVPKREGDLNKVDWNAEKQFYDYLHGYKKLDRNRIRPRYPFGFGLSYTSFKVSEVALDQDEGSFMAECAIENTGPRYGEEVVQVYVGFSNSAVERPVKKLCGFRRVRLLSRQKERVSISCAKQELCWYNAKSKAFEFENMVYEVFVGTSSDIGDLTKREILLSRSQPVFAEGAVNV